MCEYVCIYVFIFLRAHISVYMCVYFFHCTYVCVFLYTCVHICQRTYFCIYVCIILPLYICAHISVCMCLFFLSRPTYVCACVSVYIRVYVCACICIYFFTLSIPYATFHNSVRSLYVCIFCMYVHIWFLCNHTCRAHRGHEVPTISGLHKNIGLFCRISPLL